MKNQQLQVPIFDNSRGRLITVKELADRLKISTATVYDWVYRKIIPYIKVGRLVRFEIEAIEKWLSERRSHYVS